MTLQSLQVSLNQFLTHVEDVSHNAMIRTVNAEQDKPLTEFKTVLKVKSEPYDFGKFLILSTSRTPRLFNNSAIKRCKTQLYNNYCIFDTTLEKLVDYSRKNSVEEKVEKVRHKHLKKSVPKPRIGRCLSQIVDAERFQMLTEVNQDVRDKSQVESMLKDDQKRSDLFSESILMDRWVSEQKEKLKFKLTKNKRNDIAPSVASKHLHMTYYHSNEQTFKRRLFVHSSKGRNKFAGFRGQKIKKMQQNCEVVMKNIMNYYSAQNISKDETSASEINLIITKLFLKYSSCFGEEEQWYKYMSRENLINFLEDFKFKYMEIQMIQDMIATKLNVNLLQFFEVIYLLCRQDKQTFRVDILTFLKEDIVTRREQYLPKQCLLFEKNKEFIQKRLHSRRLYQKLERIIVTQVNPKSWSHSRLLAFDQIIELFWRLKIYPMLINKKKLKFFYLHTLTHKYGLTIQQTGNILIYIGLQGDQETSKQAIINTLNIVLKYRFDKKL